MSWPTSTNQGLHHSHRVVSAWTKSGETHAVTAKRAQRLNVIGALLSSSRLMTAKLWQNVNGVWFFGFLMAMIERVSKPLVVILDNASIHTAKKLKPYWDLLEERGMRFLKRPYQDEINPTGDLLVTRNKKT